MGNSFSLQQVNGFPRNEVVQLLICEHDCICLRVGFKKRNIIFILCSIVIGTSYVMDRLCTSDPQFNTDKVIEKFKSHPGSFEKYINELVRHINSQRETISNKQRSINELTSLLRQGINGRLELRNTTINLETFFRIEI